MFGASKVSIRCTQISKKILNRKCTFCKSAIADKLPALNRIARFSKVPIRCIKSVNSVSANKQKKILSRKCTF